MFSSPSNLIVAHFFSSCCFCLSRSLVICHSYQNDPLDVCGNLLATTKMGLAKILTLSKYGMYWHALTTLSYLGHVLDFIFLVNNEIGSIWSLNDLWISKKVRLRDDLLIKVALFDTHMVVMFWTHALNTQGGLCCQCTTKEQNLPQSFQLVHSCPTYIIK